MAEIDEDRVRLIVKDELNGKVVYLDTCRKQHEGDNNEMKGVQEKLKIMDGRMWGVLVACLFQLIGIIAILVKGH